MRQPEHRPELESLRATAERTRQFLLTTQHEDGRWVGALSPSALATGACVVALQAIDPVQYAPVIREGVRWLEATQHPDGGWGDAVHDPSNINSTSVAVAALAFAGGQASAVARGLAILETWGGFAAVKDRHRCSLSGLCRMVCAVAGLIPWQELPPLPVEVILLPGGIRQKVSITLPAFLGLGILQSVKKPGPLWRRPLLWMARRRALAWLTESLPANGGYEESALLDALVVMGLQGAGKGNHAIVQACVGYILQTRRADGAWAIDRDLETFDTLLSVLALDALDADLSQPRFQRVRDWLLATQFRAPFFATGAPAGGWAWATPGGWPELDDTSYGLKTLAALDVNPDHPQMRQGIAFMRQMQNKNGSWSTFVRNSPMPFDHPCPYLTGHVLSALAACDFTPADEMVRRALDWLRSVQLPDGSFESVWFRAHTCGTASILEALADLGLADDPMADAARRWLLANQNHDGSWGAKLGVPGTAEETGWALGALVQSGETGPAAEAAARWLAATQRPDGTWNPGIIGLYFSQLFYSDTHYAVAFPLAGLGRYLKAVSRPWS